MADLKAAPQKALFKARSAQFALVGVVADAKSIPVAADVLALAAAKFDAKS